MLKHDGNATDCSLRPAEGESGKEGESKMRAAKCATSAKRRRRFRRPSPSVKCKTPCAAAPRTRKTQGEMKGRKKGGQCRLPRGRGNKVRDTGRDLDEFESTVNVFYVPLSSRPCGPAPTCGPKLAPSAPLPVQLTDNRVRGTETRRGPQEGAKSQLSVDFI